MNAAARTAHILVVEDDADLRECVADALEDEGYAVGAAADGLVALEYLNQSPTKVDLILLDLTMPRMNGYRFREEQLKTPAHADIPVAILTADTDADEKAALLNAAAVGRKPLKLNELYQLVARLLPVHAEVGSDSHAESHFARVSDGRTNARIEEAPRAAVAQPRSEETLHSPSEDRYRSFFEATDISIWDEDFSAVKTLVDELKATHGEALRAFLEGNPEVVHHAIGQVALRDVNPATVRMFDAASKAELLQSLHRIFLPETHAVFIEELLAISQGKETFSIEAPLQTLTGRRIDVALTMSMPREDNYSRAIVSLMDITARKTAEREREGNIQDLQRALSFSEMFVGILAHDLRNPLSAITTAAALLEGRAETPRIATPVGRILKSADRMERMIGQLLDFTRIRLGRGFSLAREELDLAALAATAIDEQLSIYENCEMKLSVSGDLKGNWDRERLLQLLINLCGNACQHRTPDTLIGVFLDGSDTEWVRLEVRNPGVIAPQLLEHIFDPLRLGGEKQEGSSGLGLGLYITHEITLAHGGSIRVESNTDETKFIVDLPRRAPPITS